MAMKWVTATEPLQQLYSTLQANRFALIHKTKSF